jgi:uncharacterized membrane protein HdeD (DUF308 family)
MNLFRGIFLIAAGAFVIWRGWLMHTRMNVWLFYVLGVLAIALGVWRLLRKPPKPLV